MRNILYIIFTFSFFFAKAQNLVIDNSFEKRVQSIMLKQGVPPPLPCENFKSKKPNSSKSKSIHFSYYSTPEASEGNKYASLIVKSKNNKESRANAIKLTLCQPLQKDSVYNFSIMVLGQPNVQYNEVPFQVILCNNCKEAEEKGWKKNPALVQFNLPSNLAFAQNWIELNGYYKAQGGEKFIMIYNLKPEKKTKIQHLAYKNESDYLIYVDDVKLYLKNKNQNCTLKKESKKSVPKFE